MYERRGKRKHERGCEEGIGSFVDVLLQGAMVAKSEFKSDKRDE